MNTTLTVALHLQEGVTVPDRKRLHVRGGIVNLQTVEIVLYHLLGFDRQQAQNESDNKQRSFAHFIIY